MVFHLKLFSVLVLPVSLIGLRHYIRETGLWYVDVPMLLKLVIRWMYSFHKKYFPLSAAYLTASQVVHPLSHADEHAKHEIPQES